MQHTKSIATQSVPAVSFDLCTITSYQLVTAFAGYYNDFVSDLKTPMTRKSYQDRETSAKMVNQTPWGGGGVGEMSKTSPRLPYSWQAMMLPGLPEFHFLLMAASLLNDQVAIHIHYNRLAARSLGISAWETPNRVSAPRRSVVLVNLSFPKCDDLSGTPQFCSENTRGPL